MGVAFRELPGGRSRWRLPQSRDRGPQRSTHCGYCVHGTHLQPWITIAKTLARRRRVRSRHHAGCRVAVERAADRYTLICDGPLSIAQAGGGGRHVEGVPGSGWNRGAEHHAGFEINGQVGDNHQDAASCPTALPGGHAGHPAQPTAFMPADLVSQPLARPAGGLARRATGLDSSLGPRAVRRLIRCRHACILSATIIQIGDQLELACATVMTPGPGSLRVRRPMATPAWLPWARGFRDSGFPGVRAEVRRLGLGQTGTARQVVQPSGRRRR